MGWDKGRYYTRSKKVNGRVVREYVGAGEIGILAAQLDAIEMAERVERRTEERAKREELEALDNSIAELDGLTNLLAHAALYAAGFRRHHRGEWRKRRGHRADIL